MRPIPSFSRKLVSASGLAIATAMLTHAPVAQAQSFNATVGGTFGSVTVNDTVPGITSIDVNSDNAVINWIPSDTAIGGGPINFQPTSTTATFSGTSGSGLNFAVLNRIIPVDVNRPIQFNGTVNSEIVISGPGTPGGTVFFYSPGGIILGSNANFDVGSLALTTLDLAYDTGTGAFDTSGSYTFQQATVADSKVRVLNGAQINTTVSGSYVALVGPSVTNDGTITVDGSVALVAADAATLTFSPNGLFDILVTSGSSSTATVVANGGTITGPVAPNINSFHRIYMVAVAKNDAISMAIGNGSTLGFDIAGAADVVGNTVILSGGYDVVGGTPSFVPSSGGGTGLVSVTGGDAAITSNFFARANGSVNLGSNLAVGLNFASDVTIYSTGASSSLFANAGGALTVAGNTALFGDDFSGQDPALGHDVSILASSGGLATFGGNVELNSRAQGVSVFTTGGIGGAASGGLTRIEASDGGQILIQGDVILDSTGTGGAVSSFDGTGGIGNGGSATIRASGTTGSLLQIDGSASLYADGIGGSGSCPSCIQFGGAGTGGAVNILASGANTLSIAADTITHASGTGGSSVDSIAGTGTGGEVTISATSSGVISAQGLTATVDGTGGVGTGTAANTGGTGLGGLIVLSSSGVGGGSTTFEGTTFLYAEGIAGAASAATGIAANATGGSIYVGAREGTTLAFGDLLFATANGSGGSGQIGSATGTGGIVTLDAQTGGTVTVLLGTDLRADGLGGVVDQTSLPSVSAGGIAEITIGGGGLIQLDSSAVLSAHGEGSEVDSVGQAGTGLGGNARIVSSGASILSVLGTVGLSATGTGGTNHDGPVAGLIGGNGTGGTAEITFNGGLATFGSNVTIDASGLGGLGDSTDGSSSGGIGSGGLSSLSAGLPAALGNGSAISIVGTTSVSAEGAGGDAYTGGAGNGGETVISVRQGNLTLGNVEVFASGSGGDGSSGGQGGAATGGNVSVASHNALAGPALISMGSLLVEADGEGGNGSNALLASVVGGNGGSAQGGSILIAGSAGNGAFEATTVEAIADAIGGDGGNGNEAAGGNGGSAIAGSVRVGAISGVDTGSLNLGYANYDTITASADAIGGLGGTGDSGIGGAVGGNGGSATGGAASLVVEGSMVTINGLGEWQTDAIGGDGGFGDGFGTGGNAVIGSAIPAPPAGTAAIIKSRDSQPTQIGILDAADLTFSATALGGVGSIAGTSTKAGQAAAFLSDGGSINADSISLLSQANLDAAPNVIDPIKMTNSTATIITAFALTTSSATSVTLDQSLLSAGSITIDATNWVLDPVVPASLGTLEANSFMSLSSGLNLVAHANLSTQSSLFLDALGAIDLGAIDASDFVIASAGTALSLDSVSSGTFINLSATNAITTGDLFAASSISAGAQGNIVTGNITAGGGQPQVPSGPPTLIELFSDGSVSTGTIFTSSDLSVIAGNAITTNSATAEDMVFLSGSSVSTGALAASGRVLIGNASMEGLGFDGEGFDPNLFFAATLTTPVTPTPGAIAISGPVNATAFTAATHAAFSSGAITVTPSTTGSGNLLINAGSTLTAANLLAENTLRLNANGAISSGTLRSNTQGVKVVSLGSSIATGGVNARNDVLLSAAQSLSVSGTINARDVLLLSGGNVGLGAVFAGAVSTPANPTISNATGRVLIASNAMASESFLLSNSTNYAALLDAEPILLGGSVNIADRVVAGRFVSVSQGNMSAMTIAAFGSLEVESGGLVTVAQRWGSPDLEIASSDIRIVDNGNLLTANGQQVLSGLRTTPTGSVSLSSIGSGPALIGDGLTGSGYALSATELGLISAGSIFIGAVDNATNPIDMLIGNLALTAGGDIGASNLAGSTGRIAFVTGNRATQIPGGVIRVTGNITGTGFSATNVAEFATGRFELDAATGSLSLTQTGTALGGIIELSAANIHIASGTILDRLAADPFYEGHISDLNRPAAVRRPEGVLRALGLDLYPTGTLYIQNTGTSFDPAGFFADFEFTDLNPPANATPASVSVIVNGRWQTSDGIVGGVAARDLVVENGENLELYTADSSINGCAIDATACAVEPEADPVPAISSQIAIVSDNVLGNTPQFTEGTSDPGDGEDEAAEEKRAIEEALAQAEGASSPIAPPPQIIDSKPLESQPMIEQPVAGSGNPSLIGSVVNENSAEGEAQ